MESIDAKGIRNVETLKERTERLLSSEHLIDNIINFIANGGTILDMAKVLDVRFSDLMNFVHSSKDYSTAYARAKDMRSEYNQQKVFNHIHSILDADLRLIYDEDDKLLPIKDWPDNIVKALESLKISYSDKDEHWIKDFKLASTTKMLELLGKTESMYVEKVTHTHSVKLEDIIGGSFEGEE